MDISSSSTYASHKITVSGFVLTHSLKRIGTAENGFKKTLGTFVSYTELSFRLVQAHRSPFHR